MLDKMTLVELSRIVGAEHVLTSPEDLACYSYDATPMISHRPDAVVKPGSTAEVAAIVRLANQTGFKVIPRGSGTNLSGGSVAIEGGVILQLTRMDRILEIDAENLTATVEPGVVTSRLHAAVEALGLFYPPDPGSMTISTIGGNVAECAGGLRGLKYGVTKDYVMGVEVVLPTGEVISVGGKNVKDVAGYDLTRLMVGSEGTLGVITRVIVKLIPLPEAKKTLLALYRNVGGAARTVSSIIAQKVIPATLEFLDAVTLRCIEDYVHIGLPLDVGAVLLIEVDGVPPVVEADAVRVERICHDHGALQVHVAADEAEGRGLATARRSALAALARARPTTILEDATVPRSRVAEMVEAIESIARKYELTIGTFGHAGDGNLHPTILTDERDGEEMARVERAVDEIFRTALALGGTISGEHGIGLAKAPFLPLQANAATMLAMRRLKSALDPNNVLNPGKLFVNDDNKGVVLSHGR